MQIEEYLNQNIDVDGYYGSQCWDLAVRYMIDFWRFGPQTTMYFTGGVRDMFENTNEVFGDYANRIERIVNNPFDNNQLPQKGDVVFGLGGQYNSQYGHVMIVYDADFNGFWSIEQNSGNGDGYGFDDATRKVYRDYRNCMGWLRLKTDDDEEAKIIAAVESVKQEPCIEFTVTDQTAGISYVLKALGLDDKAIGERWIWETVGAANGFRPSDFDKYNAQLKVGDVVRVPTRLLPAPSLPPSTAVEIPIKIFAPEHDSVEDNEASKDIDGSMKEPVTDTNVGEQKDTKIKDSIQAPDKEILTERPVAPIITQEIKKTEPLPIYIRSFYDSLRNGAYSVGAVILANGGWDVINQLLAGDINEASLSKAAVGFGLILLGYLQEQQKQNRKDKEKL